MNITNVNDFSIIAMILIIYKSHVNAGKFTWLILLTISVKPGLNIYILVKAHREEKSHETAFFHSTSTANHPL